MGVRVPLSAPCPDSGCPGPVCILFRPRSIAFTYIRSRINLELSQRLWFGWRRRPPPSIYSARLSIASPSTAWARQTSQAGSRGSRPMNYDVGVDRALAKIRACIYDRGRVWSRHEAGDTSLASLEHMFFKKRAADQSTPRDSKQLGPDSAEPPETPKVRATWNGVLYVDEREMFESKAGVKALAEAEALEKRLRKQRQQRSR